jgi:hypothetical protein
MASARATRVVPLEALEADQAQVPADPCFGLAGAQLERTEHEPDVVVQRLPGEKPILLEHDADLSRMGLMRDDRLAVQGHAPPRGRLDAADDPQQRRLAATVGAEQADEVAAVDRERHGVDHGDEVLLADALHDQLHRHAPSLRAKASKSSLSAASMTPTITRAHAKTIWVARISRL